MSAGVQRRRAFLWKGWRGSRGYYRHTHTDWDGERVTSVWHSTPLWTWYDDIPF